MLTTKITNIADSIRSKKGITKKITLEEMPIEIESIETKSEPILQDKTIEITENGTTNIVADEGYDGLYNVEVVTNVEGGIEPIPEDYIQENLYIHYDGINNGGVGVHNASTNTWVDLKGNINSTIGSNVTINNDSIQSNGGANNVNSKIESAVFNISNEWTIEQRITVNRYTTTVEYFNPGDCFFSMNQDTTIKWGNYLKSGMIWSNGYAIDTELSKVNSLYKTLTISTTYDGTTFKNYINGTLLATVPFNLTKNMSVTLMNGAYRYQHNHVTNKSVIKIHSFRYYNRVLTEKELRKNYLKDEELYPMVLF